MDITRFGTPAIVDAISGPVDIGAPDNNRLVLILLSYELPGTGPINPATSCLVDGKAATRQRIADLQGFFLNHIEMWSIHGDQLGSSSGIVTVEISGGDVSPDWGFGHLVRYGVAQRDPVATPLVGSSTNSATVDVPGVNASVGDLVVMQASHDDQNTAISSYTSPLAEQYDDPINANHRAGAGDAILSAPLVDQTLTCTAPDPRTRFLAIVGVWSPASSQIAPAGPPIARAATDISADVSAVYTRSYAMLAEFELTHVGDGMSRVIYERAADGQNFARLSIDATDRPRLEIRAGGATIADLTLPALGTGTHRLAARIASGDHRLEGAGAAATSAAVGAPNRPVTAFFGQSQARADHLEDYLRIAETSDRYADADLAAWLAG